MDRERCGAECAEDTALHDGTIRHVCNAIDDHSGQHKCGCGYQWGARSDGR